MFRPNRRALFALLPALFATSTASAQVVISQVYGGGQGGAAVYKNDYVELFNPTANDVVVDGWSVQYQASGTTGNWSGKVPLTGTVAAHQYFLVQMSASSGSGASALDLPTPDVTSTAVSLSATAGKVALATSSGTLVTAVGPPVVCPTGSGVADLVGYGAANCAMGSPTTAPATATAVLRGGGGCMNTGNNLADFSVGMPVPRNTASPANACGSPTGSGSASPSSVMPGSATTLVSQIVPGSNPVSTGIGVTCDLSAIGGSTGFVLSNTTGNTYSALYTVPVAITAGRYSLTCAVSDSQARTGTFAIALTVGGSSTAPSATGTATPNPVTAGNSVSLSATAVAGSNPPSNTLTVNCDLSSIGGAAGVMLPANYLVPAGTSPNTYSLPCTVSDDLQRSSGFPIGLAVQGPPPATHSISEITGAGTSSPLAGVSVTTRGVVTAVRGATSSTAGFYIESLPADRDTDPNTSEGLLIFTGSTPPACAVVGNNIQIQGTVQDFVNSSAPVGSVPLTELSSVSNCQVLGSNMLGNLPAAITINNNTIDPQGSATQARKFLAMRVSMPNAVVVGPSLGSLNEPTETSTPNGTFFVTAQGVVRPFLSAGILALRRPSDAAPTVPSWNGNPQAFRIVTTGLSGGTSFEVATGTSVTGLSGIMDYDTNDGQYQIYSNASGAGSYSPSSPTLAAAPIPARQATDLLVVEANIERFYNDLNDGNGNSVTLTTTAYQGRLNKLSLAVRNVLNTPDILALEEVEGPSRTSGPMTYPVPQDIVNKINADAAASGQANPNYNWCEFATNDPSLISVAVLYRQDRVTLLDCKQYGGATIYTEPGGTTNILNDRPPLSFHATVAAPGSDSGLPVRIVVNHLRSLDSIDQPGITNGDRVRTKRNEQAKYLGNLLTGNLAEQTTNWNLTDNLLVVGDMNAHEFNDGYVDSINCITGSPAPANQQYFTAAELAVTQPCLPIPTLSLFNLTDPDPLQRYSYSFSGTAERLDHVMASAKLNGRIRQTMYARVNADFPVGPTYSNNFARPERYSDHDATAVYVTLPVEVTSRTQVNASPLVLNRAIGRNNGTITVTNTGSAALVGPVYVFFQGLPAGVTLPDLPQSNGVPYAVVNLQGGLAAGATSGSVAISFSNPANARISYTTQRFDGSF